MLIHLHASTVAEAISNTHSAIHVHEILEILLVAYYQGDHIISISREDIQYLKNSSLRWSRKASRGLDHIEENSSQIEGLRMELPWSVEVGIGDQYDGTEYVVAEKQTIIRVPPAAFDRTEKAICALCLGENKTDAGLYITLALLLRSLLWTEHVQIACERRGGGGDTTVSEYISAADRGRIILAIADADEKYPKCGYGQTFQKLKEASEGRPAYQRARALHVRTAEGLIPVEIYEEALANSPQRLHALSRIKPLIHMARADILRYAHLKEGIKLYQIQYPTSEPFGDYWGEIAQKMRRDSCTQPSHLQCTTRDNCMCFVVDPLGSNALDTVLKWLEGILANKGRTARNKIAQKFGLVRGTASPIMALAEEILSWGIAFPPLN